MAPEGEPVRRLSRAEQGLYYTRLAFTHFFLKRPRPIMGGISITDVCNLDCRHCWRKNAGQGHVDLTTITQTLERMYEKGVRYLYFQGGEPFTWRQGRYDLADLVEIAKEIGFFHVTMFTNGTFPFKPRPDSYFVSLDGFGANHDRIRGSNTFERMIANVRSSDHPRICVNITLNKENAHDLERIVSFVAEEENLRGATVNFHIPYPGVEALLLDDEQRLEVAEQAIRLKRSGLPVLNSVQGLKALGRNDWPRPLPTLMVTDCRTDWTCCRSNGKTEICKYCGYGGCAELAGIMKPGLTQGLAMLGHLGRTRVG